MRKGRKERRGSENESSGESSKDWEYEQGGVGEGVTGDVQKGQRGNDRSIKEMNGSVRIKGNTESVIIRRESRAAGGGEGDARVTL